MKESLPSRDPNCESFYAASKRARGIYSTKKTPKSKFHKTARVIYVL